MNVFKYELRSNLKQMLYWLSVALVFTILFLFMFPSFKEEGQVVLSMISAFPPELLESFGINVETFFQIEGYTGFLFMYILIIVAIQGAILSIGIFSREGRTKTLDFIFTRPKSRGFILRGKIFAVIGYLLLNAVIYIGALLILLPVVESGSIDRSYIVDLGVALLIVELFFAAFGLLLSVILPKIKSVATTAIITVMGFYILQVIENFTDSSVLTYLNPFGLFDLTEILIKGSLSTNNVLIGVAYITVFSIIAALIYCKKDIHTV